MIPKKIHYVRFGDKPIPQKYKEYISGRKKILSDYEFILRNESNFNLNCSEFTKQVAEKKKWGFIVDYIRAYVIYHHGGIYLDTDVELLKDLTPLLDNECFSGFENEKYINPGNIFAGKKGCVIAKELLEFYSNYDFLDKGGTMNLTPSPQIFTKLLLKHGLQQNNTYQELGVFTAYPTDYFCAKSFETGKIKITDNTYTIHHFAMSRVPLSTKIGLGLSRFIGSIFGKKAQKQILQILINIKHKLSR